ncbi:MAG TPA: response regulator transcription factor [Candidatus Polarisedimenticolaceae bacterium]|nr:response regulator transcription factor [Candidatus Polarisedimenticolaceae bacterium]
MRILVVEDNQKLAGYIKKALEQKSYSVDCAYDGHNGEDIALVGDYDLIILDIMLPFKDGVAVCKELRAQDIVIPIIMLTARGELDDTVVGLDSGADDYLVKPFELEELLARIRALLRRPHQKTPEVLSAQDVVLDQAQSIARKGEDQIRLTLKEFALLEYLLRNKNRTVSREQILDHCWDHTFDSFSNIVDVYIKQLRKKLDDKDETYIKTVRGLGYQFQG